MKKLNGVDKILIKTGEKIAASLSKSSNVINIKKAKDAMKAIGTLTIPRKEARAFLERFIKENLYILEAVE